MLPLARCLVAGTDESYNSSYVVDDSENPNGLQVGYWKINALLRLEQTNGHFARPLLGRDLNNAYQLRCT
jgi:hypothetical protein